MNPVDENIILNGLKEATQVGKIRKAYIHKYHMAYNVLSYQALANRVGSTLQVVMIFLKDNNIIVMYSERYKDKEHIFDICDPSSINDAAIIFKAYVAKFNSLNEDAFEILIALRKSIRNGIVCKFLILFVNNTHCVYVGLTDQQGHLRKNPTHFTAKSMRFEYKQKVHKWNSIDADTKQIISISDPNAFDLIDKYYKAELKSRK